MNWLDRLTDESLVRLAGSGSTDGYQETAQRLLLAVLTARRAAELYPDNAALSPQRDYRLAVEGFVEVAAEGLRVV